MSTIERNDRYTHPLSIRIPSGRSIPLGQYAAAWKKLLTLPPNTRVPKWDHFDTDAAVVLREMRAGMMDRINRKDPRYPKGKKAGEDYQRALAQFTPYVYNPRVIIPGIDPILGKRIAAVYAHRLRKNLIDD